VLGVDEQRAALLAKGIKGKRLTYRRPRRPKLQAQGGTTSALAQETSAQTEGGAHLGALKGYRPICIWLRTSDDGTCIAR